MIDIPGQTSALPERALDDPVAVFKLLSGRAEMSSEASKGECKGMAETYAYDVNRHKKGMRIFLDNIH